MFTLRCELPGDTPSIRNVLLSAFPTKSEADLVEVLRKQGEIALSLIAETEGKIVGHILFSPVTLNGQLLGGMGLAPLAVMPSHQRQGIGSAFVQEGLRGCRETGIDWVVVLGDKNYYQRFGFVPASQYQLKDEYGGEDHFQVLVWEPKAFSGEGGLVRYSPAFGLFTW